MIGSVLPLIALGAQGARETTSVEVKSVTGAYFRMHDPAFVAQALAGADTAGRRSAAAAVLTPEMLAGRASLLSRLAKYRTGVAVGRVTLPVVSGPVPTSPDAPVSPLGVQGAKANPALATALPSYADLVPRLAGKGSSRYVGTVGLGAKGPIARFHGTASQDGVVGVMTDPNEHFNILSIRVETGEVDQGGLLSAIEHAYAPGRTYPVKAGQDWTMDVQMGTNQLGDFKSNVVVADGVTNTFGIRGKVVPATGELAFWTEKCFAELSPNSTQEINLKVRAIGNGPTTVQITGSSTLKGVQISGLGTVNVDGQKEVTVPCKVKIAADAVDGAGDLVFRASAFGGAKSAEAQGAVQIKTVWSTTGTFTAGNGWGNSASILRWANSGYWSLTSYQVNTTKDKLDTRVGFTFNDAGYYNGNSGDMLHLGALIGGALAPKEGKTFEMEGTDARLQNPKYSGMKLMNVAMYADYASHPERFDQWFKWWYQKRPITPLSGK